MYWPLFTAALLSHCNIGASSHYLTISLSHYPTIPLSHYLTISLSHYPTIPQSHYLTIPLSHYLTISLSHYPTIPLSHYLTIPLSHYLTAPLHNCTWTAAQSHCLTASILTKLLSHHPQHCTKPFWSLSSPPRNLLAQFHCLCKFRVFQEIGTVLFLNRQNFAQLRKRKVNFAVGTRNIRK